MTARIACVVVGSRIGGVWSVAPGRQRGCTAVVFGLGESIEEAVDDLCAVLLRDVRGERVIEAEWAAVADAAE